MLTLAIANQKGGVGKTTSALNLAYGMISANHVLLVDMDPQASLTMALGISHENGSLADVIKGILPMRAIIQSKAGVDIAPASLELAGAELEIVSRLGREYILRKALAALDYDLAILDCGPSLGLLVINALVAAQGVICPVVPDALGLRGLALFLDSLKVIKQELNPGLETLGVIVTQYDKRSTLHQVALAELRDANLQLLGVIKKSVAMARSAGRGLPIQTGELAEQYNQVIEKVQLWLETKSN